MHHIFRLTESFRRRIDPRERFEEAVSDEDADDLAEIRELHARHLFRSLVIEDMLSHA